MEFNFSNRNSHGSGFDMKVSNPIEGNVDIIVWQVVCGVYPEEPSVSLSVPVSAAMGMLSVLNGGVQVALMQTKETKFH